MHSSRRVTAAAVGLSLALGGSIAVAHADDGTTSHAGSTTTGSGYTPLGPVRIMDTRNGTGGETGRIYSGGCFNLPVAGVDGIPADASAVALNLTVTDTISNGLFYLGTGSTVISNLNYTAGQTVANSAIVPIDSSSGGVLVCSAGDSEAGADAIVDATGYFTKGSGQGFQPTTPDRILDTRNGTGAPKAKVGKDSGVSVTVDGVDSIPASGVSAVAVHVTEVDATGSGWIAAEPDGSTAAPTTSSLNYGAGLTISNTVIVPVGADGKFELYNGAAGGSVDLLADVSGYFSASAPDTFTPVTPYRSADTRSSGSGPIRPGGVTTIALNQVLNGTGQQANLPPGAMVAANVTATDETANGALTVYPANTALPNVSALNYRAGQNVAGFGLFSTTTNQDEANVYNSSTGSTDVIMDVFGYFD